MTPQEAREQLASLVSAAAVPALTDAELDQILSTVHTTDATGADVWNLPMAASEAYVLKAAKASATAGRLQKITADGATFERARVQTASDFMALADYWRGRAGLLSHTIGVVELNPVGGLYPGRRTRAELLAEFPEHTWLWGLPTP